MFFGNIPLKTRIEYIYREKLSRPTLLFIKSLLDIFADKEILVLGDSHVEVFNSLRMKYRFPRKKFIVHGVKGATASGLENPNSKTQAIKEFRRVIFRHSNVSNIIVNLGEVDTGFVIWYRAKKYNEPVGLMLNQAVKKYCNFIDDLKCDDYRKVIVISATLPTIANGQGEGPVYNLRKEITASQKDRTQITLQFNKMVEDHCKDIGVIHVSLDKYVLGENGLVHQRLLSKNREDHHYNSAVYADILFNHLNQILC